MAGRRFIHPDQVAEWEARLRAAVTAALEEQFHHVRANLSRHGIDLPTSLVAASNKRKAATVSAIAGAGVVAWNASTWAAAVAKHITPVANQVADEAFATAKAAVPSDGTWGMPDPTAGYAANLAATAAASGAYVGQRLNTNVAGAADPGQAASDTLDTADDIVGNVTGMAAEGLSNAATYDVASYVADYMGVSGATQTWSAVGDETTRAWHLDADGQEVPLGEPFIVDGEELDYPGDPAGSDSNTMGCRCWTTTDGIDPGIAIYGPPDDQDTATGLENTTNRIGRQTDLPLLPRSHPN